MESHRFSCSNRPISNVFKSEIKLEQTSDGEQNDHIDESHFNLVFESKAEVKKELLYGHDSDADSSDVEIIEDILIIEDSVDGIDDSDLEIIEDVKQENEKIIKVEKCFKQESGK